MQFGDDGKTWIDYEQQGVKRVRTRLQTRKKALHSSIALRSESYR